MKVHHWLWTTIAIWFLWAVPGYSRPRGNRAVEVRGAAQVKRQGQTSFRNLRVGTQLRGSDIIRLSKKGKVTIGCANNSVRSWFKGQTVVSRLCPTRTVRRLRSRGECDDPARFLSLLRGLCQKPEIPSLDTEQMLVLVQRIGAINAQDIDREAKLLLQAEAYRERKLYGQTIATLEPLVEAESQTQIVYQWLGNAYEYTGKVDLAQQRYQRALSLAKAEENDPEAGDAAYGLAKLAARQKDLVTAERWLQQATASYGAGQLEDEQEQMEELLRKVGVLRQRG